MHNSRYSCVIMVLYKSTHDTVCMWRLKIILWSKQGMRMDCSNEFQISRKMRQLMVITCQDQERVKWPWSNNSWVTAAPSHGSITLEAGNHIAGIISLPALTLELHTNIREDNVLQLLGFFLVKSSHYHFYIEDTIKTLFLTGVNQQ